MGRPTAQLSACRRRAPPKSLSPAQEKEPRLPGLLKILLWAQSQLDDKVVYPHIDLTTGRLSDISPQE